MATPTSQAFDERETLRSIPTHVTVRDVVRHTRHELSGSERMLRVPYDLFKPIGPVHYEGDLITYLHGGGLCEGNVSEGRLREAHPGERVLLLLPGDGGAQAPNEWWLCEVEENDDDEE